MESNTIPDPIDVHKVFLMVQLFIAAIFVVLMPVFCLAEQSSLTNQPAVNPHMQSENCDICHVISQDDLNSWFTFPSTKKAMKKDLNSTCQQCHGVEFGHGIGKWTKLNRANLPLDSEGYIACAITCHDMHVKATDQHQNKFHLRAPSMKLCLSCHDQ